MYEGGIRVPMLAYWEGKINEGQTTNHPSTFYDVMPTIAEVAGVEIPKQTDGISILPVILVKNQPNHNPLYWELQEGPTQNVFRQAARKGKWKVVRYGASYKTELYDLESDLFETIDISKQHPEIVEEMNNILKSESEVIEHYPNSGGIFK